MSTYSPPPCRYCKGKLYVYATKWYTTEQRVRYVRCDDCGNRYPIIGPK